MRGGKPSRATRVAFKAPPIAPRTSAPDAATQMGAPASRHSVPNSTADNPIIEPTDKSIPPVMITGVRARANNPISTLKRTTSAALVRVKKLVPARLNTPISMATTKNCIHSRFGKSRRDRGRSTENVSAENRSTESGFGSDIPCTSSQPAIGRNGGQDYSALDRFFPIRTRSKEGERGADCPEQYYTDGRSPQGSPTPSDGSSAYDDSRNDFELEADAGVALNLSESNRIQEGGCSDQRSRYCEDTEDNSLRANASEPGRFAIGAGCIDRSAS